MASLAAPRSLTSRLIATSQLAGVMLFGALLLQPWQATNPVVGTIFILACAAFAVLAMSAGIGERALMIVPGTSALAEVAETGAEGTTFGVELPAAPLRAGVRTALSDAPTLVLRSPLAGMRLLFVDDEPTLRTGMEAFGRLRGFTVLTASDGSEALSHARSAGVDAVVCDLRMPGMDGRAFHAPLRDERPALAARTVFVTGDLVPSVTGETVPRQPVLTKPFSFDTIEEAVVAVMRGASPSPSPTDRADVPR